MVQELGKRADMTVPSIAKAGTSDSLAKLADIDEVVANAVSTRIRE